MQKQLTNLTDIIALQMEGKPPRFTKLKGMWAGKFEVSDRELEKAKEALMPDADIAQE